MSKAIAMTVSGPVPTAELGPTLMHEHIMNDCSCWWAGHDPEYKSPIRDAKVDSSMYEDLLRDPFGCLDNCVKDDEELAAQELDDVISYGCRTVVDPTNRGIGRNPEALQRISQNTGLNIVMGSGYYLQTSHPGDFAGKFAETIADEIQAEYEAGVEDTRIQIGLIGEIGVSCDFSSEEKKSLTGAIIAAVRTGLPLMVHLPAWDRLGHNVLDMAEAGGLDCKRVILCHMNPSCKDQEYQCALAKRGAYIEYDMIGMEYIFENGRGICPTDQESAQGVLDLASSGYIERILLSQDVFIKSMLRKYGGKGYGTIFRDFIPILKRKGMEQPEIDTLLVSNPAHALSINQ